jgi:hypothetical protein
VSDQRSLSARGLRCFEQRRWFFLWLRGNGGFNVHRSPDCCVFAFTIGRLAFRWPRG